MRRLLLLLAAVGVLISAAPAHATKITPKKSMWGPVLRDGESQFPIYADLGVGIYQMSLNWSDVATQRPADPTDPADPAYEWPADIDLALSEADKYGMRVSLAVLGTPGWANGGRPFSRAPDKASDYADFITATARRYPQVHLWMIWIEPTKAANWQPLTPDRGQRLRGAGLRGPHRYAQLLDQSYARLKALSPANLVIGGNTFTVGSVAPLRWVSALKLPSGRRPRMDLWGHNPFSARVPNLSADPLGAGFADFSDLDELAHALDRAFRHAPLAKERHLKLFLSEFSLPTDHRNFEFNFFVDRRTQARWTTRALRIVRTYKRIFTFGYLGLYDDPLRDDGEQVERGLLTRDGERKPAYEAFKKG